MTFAARLAAERPGERALRDPERSWTWAEADDALRPLVNGLLAVHWRPPRRVAIYAENSGQTLLYYAAATLAGCSAVAMNFHLEPAEAAYILGHSSADVVLVDDASAPRGVEAARLAGAPAVVGGSGVVPGAISLPEAASYAGDAEPPAGHPPRPTMVYTSGTTGLPKGVELPPTSWVGGDDIGEHLDRLARNPMVGYGRHLIVGPMYHSGPLTGSRLFLGGAPITVLGRFDAEGLLAAVHRDRIASTIVVPTHLQRALALPAEVRNRYDLSSLRFVLQVGAKFPERDKRAAIDWLRSSGAGDVLWESYGASEVGTTCMISTAEWRERPGSVGRAIEPFEAMILDEADRPVPPGTEGRLFFTDRTGYGIHYVDGEPSDGSHIDGSAPFTLGEIGVMDAEGYVWITDRASDLIVSGGVNIYPAEAEAVLAAHPGVAEAACIGVPHPDLGEALIALVVPTEPTAAPAPEDLLAHCGANLTRYKCPREIRLVDALLRTPVGKLDKRALRAAHAPDAAGERRPS